MDSTNRKRSLIVSGAIILLCMTFIVGMTFALFTDTQKVTNHLQAGDMQITLRRTELRKTTLNAEGFLTTTKPNTVVKDFTKPTDENVFGLLMKDGSLVEKIVPGSKFTATMQIENNCDVAFGYWVKIECEDEYVAKNLAKQLIVTVYTDKNGDGFIDLDKESDESTVARGLSVGDDKNHIGTLGLGDKENFIVSVEFADTGYNYVDGVLTSTNDAAKNQEVKFDLVVYAVQATAMPTTP